MKRILFLLLLTVSVYGQNPSRFAKIQITGNTNSGTATKVNVQEANGEVNTQTINTGFNKNIGLGGSDVVGATTLLNQYSTTPVDWTASAFNSGQVVFYVGKQWVSKIATVAGDVPAVSSKWEEITFDALANKTTTVDQTIIDGSTNAVAGNAVFDGLALKSNIGHTHVASQITDLSKASVGLGNVDNTSDLSKPLSTATINALATKFPTPTGLTTNYLPKWNGSGFGNSQIFDDGTKVGIGGTITPTANLEVIDSNQTASGDGNVTIRTTDSQAADKGGLLTFGGSYSGNSRTVFGGISGRKENSTNGNIAGYLSLYSSSPTLGLVEAARVNSNGTTNFNYSVTAPTAPAGTNTTQIATTAFVQANTRPYKVYTALLSQSGTNAPIATVLENTLGGTVVWGRDAVGSYTAILPGAWIGNKTFVFVSQGSSSNIGSSIRTIRANTADLRLITYNSSNTLSDNIIDNNAPIEIRVYN